MDLNYLELFNHFNFTNYDDENYTLEDPIELCHKIQLMDFSSKYLPPFLYIIFIISILGNTLVLYILFKYEKLSSITNTFLINLIISDLIFTFSLPFIAIYHVSGWIFGQIMCKLISSLFSIGFYNSIFFLTLLTFDRYLTVVHTNISIRCRTQRYVVGLSLFVWMLSLISGIKEMFLHNIYHDSKYGTMCEYSGYQYYILRNWELFGYYQQFILFFLIPFVIIFYCYICMVIKILSSHTQKKNKAIKLIFFIVVIFFICWTPYNIVILLQAIEISLFNDNCPSDALDYAHFITRNLAFFYCCISPLLYVFVSKKFQNHFKKLLSKHISCLKSPTITTDKNFYLTNPISLTQIISTV